MKKVKHYSSDKIETLDFIMNAQDQQLPKDWVKLNTPNLYLYKDFIVRQKDQLGGNVELIAYGFTGKQYSVVTDELISAMNEMSGKLKLE